MRVSTSSSLTLALLAAAGLASLGAAHAGDPVVGSGSATFVNPVLADPSGAPFLSGVGTSDLKFGDSAGGPQNELSFHGSAFNSVIDTPFKIGTLGYFNGTSFGSTQINSVDLKTSLVFTTPNIGGTQTFTFEVPVTTTPNTANQHDSADYITLASSFSSQIFTIGSNVYTLQLTGFQNVDASHGYLGGPGNDELHVFENEAGSADLYGKVTLASNNPSAVPEPSQAAAMSIGILGLTGLVLVRRRKSSVTNIG